MKPIGILTFHRASNYGAVLQAYALQQVISGLGRKAVIVDYRCRTVEEGHRPWGLFKRHKFPVVLFRRLVAIKKDRIFGAFRKNRLTLSRPMQFEDLEGARDDYALFVAGSDQVWNNKLSGMDPAYMLVFAKEQQRYSYACSLGFDAFPEGTKELYREWLTGMQCISLRETRSVDLLETIGFDASENSIAITVKYAQLPQVRANSTQWSQAFTALLAFLCECLKVGKTVTPYIKVATAFSDGGIQVKFNSNCLLFDESEAQRIFEPFFANSHSHLESCMSLGMVREVVYKHNGTVEAEFDPSSGLGLLIKVPVDDAENQ